jgi:hypothetical protein
MINGAHAILYSDDAEVTRATLAKVLGTDGRRRRRLADLRTLPAELAVHPAEQGGRAELYFMTDDVATTATRPRHSRPEPAQPVGKLAHTCLRQPAAPHLAGRYQAARRSGQLIHEPAPARACYPGPTPPAVAARPDPEIARGQPARPCGPQTSWLSRIGFGHPRGLGVTARLLRSASRTRTWHGPFRLCRSGDGRS